MRLLYIEDDQEMAIIVKKDLQEYYSVDIAHTGAKGWTQIQSHEYDLIIVDFMLPDFDGVEICRRIRAYGLSMPILILTGEYEVETKVMALEAGADDYLTKPFVLKELLARIRALLRRPSTFVSDILTVGELKLDLQNHVAIRRNQTIPLRRKEFRILEYLMRNIGQTITKQMILEHAWESSYESSTNIVEVNINYLRERIDKPFKKNLIKTVHGLGYKIEV
jgi:DNA-binding response OmpR family regulator